MGYNTRRKSLSLTELGITLPKRARTQSHPSPPSTIVEGDENERPSKKSRLMSPPEIIKEDKTKHAAQLSPPPSPVAEGRHKVSVEGIGDDIVVGTIQQLEQTGNRPHLVKELATVLATNLHSVDKSANPSALISSRLTAYLNRPWPAMSPCPLAKDLSPVHPRRLYFFLTTLPRQPIPDTIEPPLKPANRIISPSLSSASAADEEDLHRYDRTRVSLSPEVDLSSPELEDGAPQEPPTPGAPFSGRNSVAPRERSASATQLERGRRGGSPQLEHEERDFKQTANALFEQAQLQMRRRSSLEQQQQQQQLQQEQIKKEGDADMDVAEADVATVAGAEQVDEKMGVAVSIEAFPLSEAESVEFRNTEDATALFPQVGGLKLLEHEGLGLGLGMFGSSPLIEAQDASRTDTVAGVAKVGGRNDDDAEERVEVMHLDLDLGGAGGGRDLGGLGDWEALQSPENVELAELEDLFDAY